MKTIDVRIKWDENKYIGPPPIQTILNEWHHEDDMFTVRELPSAPERGQGEQHNYAIWRISRDDNPDCEISIIAS